MQQAQMGDMADVKVEVNGDGLRSGESVNHANLGGNVEENPATTEDVDHLGII